MTYIKMMSRISLPGIADMDYYAPIAAFSIL
jgi:hypothetical protein